MTICKFQTLLNKTDEEIIDLFNTHKSINQVILALGFKGSDPRAQKYLSNKRKELDIPSIKHQNKSNSIINESNLDLIKQFAQESSSVGQLLAKLNLIPHAHIFVKLKAFLKEHEICCNAIAPKWSDDKVYCENSDFPRGYINRRFKKDNLKPYCCNICGIAGIWNNQPIILQVDHINGIPNDNRVENLRWLCPNCHSQTSTWAGKNIKHY